ncbi:MAG: AlpA family phage regulatory protein [Kiloniellales bacterium]
MHDNQLYELPCRLLTRKQLLEIVPFSYPTIWELMRRGAFPKALHIGAQKVAWREDEVRAWIDSRPRQELKGDAEGQE